MVWTTEVKADIAMVVALLILIVIYWLISRKPRASLREMKREDYKRIAMLYGLKPRWWWTEKRTRRESMNAINNIGKGRPAGTGAE